MNDLKDFKESIKDYDKAIAIDQKFSEAYELRGITKLNMGDTVAAMDDLDKAMADSWRLRSGRQGWTGCS